MKLEFEFKQSDSRVSFPDHYSIIILHLNIIHKVKYDTYVSFVEVSLTVYVSVCMCNYSQMC